MYSNGRYTYIYTDTDSYEPLAQIHNYTNEEFESKQETNYFHCDQIGIPREMTDKDGRLLWFGDYYGWGKLKSENNITETAHQPFRLQNQYCDQETGLHYNFFRYYEPDAGRFVNQDPIGLWGGTNFYQFAVNAKSWTDPLGLCDLDWSGVDPHGLSRKDHVRRHGQDDPGRCGPHGVFADDPIEQTEAAWEKAKRDNITPTQQGNRSVYTVPFPEAGLQGGDPSHPNHCGILNNIRIVVENGNKVIAAFPI
ncbi:RHS repeat-associated core domain-containing protein [Neisseria animaloris]|uniref:RHS repeat-associated core domain-containing protein n=1 Tax=Neisseria animaloris TaxID=326522 RepID=UPI001E389319|nr:RHS repeat-associated core domain-containing protein [Neisseria animaloris]